MHESLESLNVVDYNEGSLEIETVLGYELCAATEKSGGLSLRFVEVAYKQVTNSSVIYSCRIKYVGSMVQNNKLKNETYRPILTVDTSLLQYP